MKVLNSIVVFLIIVLSSLSVLFKGLFFNLEESIFLTLLLFLSFIYLFIKTLGRESLKTDKWLIIFGSGIVAAYILNIFTAGNFRENIGIGIRYASILLISVIIYDYFTGKRDRLVGFLLVPVVLSGLLCSLISLIHFKGVLGFLYEPYYGTRYGTTFQYQNTASIYFAVCVLLSLTIVLKSENLILKLVFSGIGNILLFAQLQTASRGGFLFGTFGILLFLAFQKRGQHTKALLHFLSIALPLLFLINKYNSNVSAGNFIEAYRWLAISVIVTMLLLLVVYFISKIKVSSKVRIVLLSVAAVFTLTGIVFVYVNFGFTLLDRLNLDLFKRLANTGANDTNILGRLDFSRDALKLIEKNWVTGYGGGGWTSNYRTVQTYLYTANDVHNNFLQVFVESGIIGFLSYLGLIIYAIKKFLVTFFKKVELDNILPVGLFSASVSLVLHSGIDFDLSYMSMLVLFQFLLTGLVLVTNKAELAGNIFDLNENKKTESRESILNESRLNESRLNESKLNESRLRKSKIVILPFLVISALLLPVKAVHSIAAYNGKTGYMYLDKKDYKAARLYLEEAVRLDSRNSNYTLTLARIYFNYSRITKPEFKELLQKKALNTALKGISYNTGEPEGYKLISDIYKEMQMPEKALEYYYLLIQKQPRDEAQYVQLGQTYIDNAVFYMQKGDKLKATEQLQKCSFLGNTVQTKAIKELYKYKLLSYLYLGDYSKAYEFLKTLHEIELENKNLANDLRIIEYSLNEIAKYYNSNKASSILTLEEKYIIVNSYFYKIITNNIELFRHL